MKGIDILELIDAGTEEIDEIIDDKLEKDERYKKAEKEFLEMIEPLEQKYDLDIESAELIMETWAREVAFNEGFKMGVRLIISCMGEAVKA